MLTLGLNSLHLVYPSRLGRIFTICVWLPLFPMPQPAWSMLLVFAAGFRVGPVPSAISASDFFALQEILQATDAEPAIAEGLEWYMVLTLLIRHTVVLTQQVH